jgi:hypothetical protein
VLVLKYGASNKSSFSDHAYSLALAPLRLRDIALRVQMISGSIAGQQPRSRPHGELHYNNMGALG